MLVWAEMEVKGFAKGGECQSEGVSMVESGRIWGNTTGRMG